MKTSHLGLVQRKDDRIISFRYIESKFERQLGDKMNIEGLSYEIIAIAEYRNEIISYLNEKIKQIRLQNR